MTEQKMLIVQEWEESEAGWGVRPDGYSLHLTQKECDEYIQEYWAGMPKQVQHEYSRVCGPALWVLVSDAMYDEVKNGLNGKKGYRVWHSAGRIVTSKTGARSWEEKK